MCGLEEKTDRIFILREDEYKSTDTSHEIMEMFLFFFNKNRGKESSGGEFVFFSGTHEAAKGTENWKLRTGNWKLETGNWELGPGD